MTDRQINKYWYHLHKPIYDSVFSVDDLKILVATHIRLISTKTCHVSDCESYQFTCQNGQCISGFRYCDGQIDCSDASDEPITGCQCK